MKRKLMAVDRQTAFGWAPSTTLRDGIAQTYAHFTALLERGEA
jgi:GDP-L-fucose synthase